MKISSVNSHPSAVVVAVSFISVIVRAAGVRAATISSTFDEGNFNEIAERSSGRSNSNRFPVIIDQFDHRKADGSYEFRYELSDGTARYERGYFVLVNNLKSLVVAGYYSYRMPDGRYMTVFYNADRHGFRQNSNISPQPRANLPRTLDISEEGNNILTTQFFSNAPSNHLSK